MDTCAYLYTHTKTCNSGTYNRTKTLTHGYTYMRENIKEDIIKKNLVLKENKNINKIFVYEKSIRLSNLLPEIKESDIRQLRSTHYRNKSDTAVH